MNKKRILLVDDEPALLELMQIRLEASGYEIIPASDGQQALDLARKEMPELIILDLMLPKVDGYKVCRVLKSDDRYKKIPILLFTARGNNKGINTSSNTMLPRTIPVILSARTSMLFMGF